LDANAEGVAMDAACKSLCDALARAIVGLEDLREPDPYGPPSAALPDEITPLNFRRWLNIQLAPEPSVHEEQNVCYDVWLAAVDHDGALRVGYFEAWEPS
jgi:hypothetical protein